MRAIYSAAKQVVVWPGVDQEDEDIQLEEQFHEVERGISEIEMQTPRPKPFR